MKKYEHLSAKGPAGTDFTDRGRVVGAVMEVPGALGKDMAAILRKAAAYAVGDVFRGSSDLIFYACLLLVELYY
jgi:hypothetical protein